MATELSRGLQKLHELLRKLGEAEKTLSQGPRRISVAEKAVKAARDAIEAQKLEIKNSRKHADELNLKLRSKETDLVKLTGMLNQASSNKEYDIMKGQIQTAKGDQASIEEIALTAMEAADEIASALKGKEADLKQKEQHLKDVQAEVQAAEAGLKATIAELEAQVAQAETVLSAGDIRNAYGRLRLAHGAEALAAAEDSFCTSCSNKITTQDLVRMNTGTILLCRECGRILYVVD
ncbi:MAG: hypothetical protein JNL58_06380 [Planctomyces sp.]|nr:hypothetical protein [Planctomyces sp.]